MELLDSDIIKYQKLYKAQFGKDIDKHNAREQLSKLVRQMELIYQPITKQQLEDFKEARKRDAKALAELTYDMYQEEKAKSKRNKKKS